VAGGARRGWRRLRWHVSPLRALPPFEQRTTHKVAADAIRWLPPVRISGETLPALFCQPDSSAAFRVRAPGGARVMASCGLLPQVWADHRGAVEFALTVRLPDTGWERRRTRSLDPGARWVDRRWRPLAIRLPEGPLRDVIVRVEARVTPGTDAARAWAVFGEPRVEWRRTPRESWRSVRALVDRVRAAGLRGALRQLRDLQASDEHAARYRQWVALNTPGPDALAALAREVAALPCQPLISILTPVYNTDPRWLRACIESVRHQVYPRWELCLADDGSTSAATARVLEEYAGDARIRLVRRAQNGGISAASNDALAMATGDFVALLDHDDELTPDGLAEIVRALNTVPDTDLIYSDEDKLDAAGERCDPYFKPDWSPEHVHSCNYICHLTVARTALVRELGGFRTGYEGAQDYDLVLRLIERTDRIHHVSKVLYHWRKIPGSVATSGLAKTWAMDAGARALQDAVARRRVDAAVVPGAAPGLYRVRHRIAGRPLVSIVIPTDARSREVGGRTIDLLANCVGSIASRSTYDNYEILVVDNGRLSDEAARLLQTIPHRRVTFQYSGAFNYSRKMNFGVGHSRGAHVVLFNDDVEVIGPEWMEALLEYSQQEPIGAVGARLLYPDGRLQHIGVVMGVCGMAAHAFHSHAGSSAGYGSSALIVRNYSAVTAACLMTRRDLYERLGGFDERFEFDFNDTDYCLRLRQAGYRVVYTPYAELYHLEAATSGLRRWNASDVEEMQRRWADVCERDPYYNPNLTRDFPDCRVKV
jgi:GT2 family glycosyltransferase